jgi:DNA-binding transcriptional MerR regulator
MRKRTKEEIIERDYLKMSELAEYCGVRYSTIKYYSELGLIPYEQKGDRLAKYYPKEEASKRVKKILDMRQENKSVPEIITYFIGSK